MNNRSENSYPIVRRREHKMQRFKLAGPRKNFSASTQPSTTPSTFNAIFSRSILGTFGAKARRIGRLWLLWHQNGDGCLVSSRRARHNVTVSPEYVFEAVAWIILSN